MSATARWQVEERDPASLLPYPENPRDNDAAVAAVAASIQAFGFRQPIVVDGDGVIVVGHTRWRAAQSLGLERVPVHVAIDLTPAQLRAYRIADNKTQELASWNADLLGQEMRALGEVDWGLFGFGAKELAQLLDSEAQPGLTDPDAVPAPPDAPSGGRGDVWDLGPHRLMCGDSGNPDDVDRLLDGRRVDLVHTDPPYNVKVEPRSNNAVALKKAGRHHQTFDTARAVNKRSGGRKQTMSAEERARRQASAVKPTHTKLRAKDRELMNDYMSDEAFAAVLDGWCCQIARVLPPGRAFYMWGGFTNLNNYPPALAANGLYFAQAIIWDKEHPVLTRKDFMLGHELCFYGWREGAAHRFLGPPNISDIWHVKKMNHTETVHLTEKPVELAIRAMTYSSTPDEVVMDSFGGSGSTLIAAHQLGRVACLMELDPLYCDVIVQRWEAFTGERAVYHPHGR